MPTEKSYASERRTQPRFKVKSGMFSLGSRLGKINDISIGGLSFNYIDKNSSSQNSTHGVGIIFDDNDLCLDRVPVYTITDVAVPKKGPSQSSSERRCGVQFLELSPVQQVLLENFIWFNTETPR